MRVVQDLDVVHRPLWWASAHAQPPDHARQTRRLVLDPLLQLLRLDLALTLEVDLLSREVAVFHRTDDHLPSKVQVQLERAAAREPALRRTAGLAVGEPLV